MSDAPTSAAPTESQIRRAIAKILLLIFFAVLVPGPVMSALGFGAAGSFVGLAGVGVVTVALTAGLRVALVAALGAGAFAALLVFASVTWWSAAVVMSLVAVLFGLTARKGWQGGFVTLAMSLSFIASEGATVQEPLERAAAVLGIGFLVWGAIVAGITALVFRKPVLPTTAETRRTVIGYVGMLTVVTFITQSLAIAMDLGHSGGWLVMTPFLVILPHIHAGFRKSLRRAGGTVIGFAIVIGLAYVITSTAVLSVIGVVAFTAAMYAKLRNWNYFYFALFLTPGIVILEGVSSSVTQLAEYRLEATLGAIAISLIAMGIASLVGRKVPPSAHTEQPRQRPA